MALNKPRENVTLSTGDIITIRKLKSMDFAMQGAVPDAMRILAEKAAENGGVAPIREVKQLDRESYDFVARVVCSAIVTHLPGQRLVAKWPEDITDPEEFSFYELEDVDVNALMKAVYGFVEGGAQKALTFPEKQIPIGDVGSAGPSLRPVAERDSEQN